MDTIRRTAAVGLVAALALFAAAVPAGADQSYHSAHIALAPVEGAPLRTGFVENTHSNGPVRYAHELYILNGAEPDTDYQVTISLWAGNLTCSGAPDLVLDTAAFTTNGAGNAVGQHIFAPSDAGGLRGATVSAMWAVSSGGTVEYVTGCELINLD